MDMFGDSKPNKMLTEDAPKKPPQKTTGIDRQLLKRLNFVSMCLP